VDPKAGLNGFRKSSAHTGNQFPDRLARSESLYVLRYPGPHIITLIANIVIEVVNIADNVVSNIEKSVHLEYTV
jgi:hypothetical protein